MAGRRGGENMTERDYMDEEIEDGFIEQVKRMMKAYRESDWDEQRKAIKYLRRLLSKFEESSAMLEELKIKPSRIKYTGKKIGRLRIFKVGEIEEEEK
jgi:hypothetical protein